MYKLLENIFSDKICLFQLKSYFCYLLIIYRINKMKKLLSLIAATVLFTSCQEDIQTNTPAFQANFNNAEWRANDARVSIDETGAMTITAYTQYETVVLETSSSNLGTYILGTENTDNFVSYNFGTKITEK